jgi:hypothetical protein
MKEKKVVFNEKIGCSNHRMGNLVGTKSSEMKTGLEPEENLQ